MVNKRSDILSILLLFSLLSFCPPLPFAQEFSFHGVLLPDHAKSYDAFQAAAKRWYTKAELKWVRAKNETVVAPAGVSVTLPDSVIEDTFPFHGNVTVTLIRGGKIQERGTIASVEAAYIPRAGDNQRILFRVEGIESAPERDDWDLGDPYRTEYDLYIIGDYEIDIVPVTTVMGAPEGMTVKQMAEYFRHHKKSRNIRGAFMWPVSDTLFVEGRLESNLERSCDFRTFEMNIDGDDLPDYVIEARSRDEGKGPFWRFSFIKLTSVAEPILIAGAQFDYVAKTDGISHGIFRVQSWGKGIRGWEVVRMDPARGAVKPVFTDYSRSD
jgi:hypothetical protein